MQPTELNYPPSGATASTASLPRTTDNGRSVPATSQNTGPQRLSQLDLLRGLLIALMTNTHAGNLLGVDRSSMCFGTGCLPAGWATTSFLMLTGLVVGMHWLGSAARHPEKHVRRFGWRLLVLMFLSNIVMLALKALVMGKADTLLQPGWWIGLVTLTTPYSISAILLPSALLLLAVSCVPATWLRQHRFHLFAFSLALMWVFGLIRATAVAGQSRLIDLLFLQGLGGFPIAWMFGAGLVGLTLGMIAGRGLILRGPAFWLITGGLALVAYFAMRDSVPDSLAMTALKDAAFPVLRFPILFAAAVLIGMLPLPPGRSLARLLTAIGRFGLMSFFAHRIILQVAYELGGDGLSVVSPTTAYFVLLCLVLLSLGLLAAARQRVRPLDRLMSLLRI